MQEAVLRSAYIGAACVYLRKKALAAINMQECWTCTKVFTFVIYGMRIVFYAHYAKPIDENNNEVEYHQYEIASVNLTGCFHEFPKGIKIMRKLQELAEANAERLLERMKANGKH